MECKLYIHGDSVQTIVSLLEQQFGAAKTKAGCYFFPEFDICFDRNDEADANKMRTYPDGFLYYEWIADLDIYDHYIRITDTILKLLWENRFPAVASCDYEAELNRYIFSL